MTSLSCSSERATDARKLKERGLGRSEDHLAGDDRVAVSTDAVARRADRLENATARAGRARARVTTGRGRAGTEAARNGERRGLAHGRIERIDGAAAPASARARRGRFVNDLTLRRTSTRSASACSPRRSLASGWPGRHDCFPHRSVPRAAPEVPHPRPYGLIDGRDPLRLRSKSDRSRRIRSLPYLHERVMQSRHPRANEDQDERRERSEQDRRLEHDGDVGWQRAERATADVEVRSRSRSLAQSEVPNASAHPKVAVHEYRARDARPWECRASPRARGSRTA